jgi:hypothetical protein
MSKPFQFSMRSLFYATALFCIGAWEFAAADFRLGYLLWILFFAIFGAALGIMWSRPVTGALSSVAAFIVLAGFLWALTTIDITRDHAHIFPWQP